MADVRFVLGDFPATEGTAEAVTDRGREVFAELFGQGARSVTLPKSRVAELTAELERRGLFWWVA